MMQQKAKPAVRISRLTKAYKLYQSPRDRLLEAFHPFSKQYHRPFNALEDIDIEIPAGTTTGIVGRNGSGKSTLLQCICGIVSPTSGTVEVNGKIAALLELGAGFNPEFSGRDNLYINGAILGLEEQQITERLEDILAFADIGEYIDQPVRSYSSGMYVRLAFAIAIHVDPEILIVDEALAVGDIQFQARCFDRFHRFRQQGVTVIFVTHDLNMVTRYCDHAYLLDQARIVSSGEPREVVAEYRKREVKHRPDAKHDVSVNQNQPDFNANPYEVRYGTNKANIVEGGIYDIEGNPVQTLDSGELYDVRMRVDIAEQLIDPVFAFTIKDVKGTEIGGANSSFSEMKPGEFNPGDQVTVTFRQRIVLNAGSFLLSLGCVSSGGENLEVYDRRHDFLSFQVIIHRPTVGFVDLQSEIHIERE